MRQASSISSPRQRQIVSFLIFVSIILFISIFAIVSTSQRRDANINNDTVDDGTIVTTPSPGINNGTMMIRGTLRPSVAPTTTTLAPSADQQLMTIIIVSDGSGNMTIVENPSEEEPQPQLEPADFYTPTDETTKAPVPAATTTTNEETGEASSMPTNDPSRRPSSYSLPTVSPTTDMVYLTSTSPPTNSPPGRPSNVPTDHPSSSDYAPTLKPTFIPTQEPALPSSSPLAMSPFAYDNYVDGGSVVACTSSQVHLRIELVTDDYPRDTSWQFIDRTNNVILLSSPVDGYSGADLGNGRMESQSDTRDICLGDDGGSGSSSSTSRTAAATGPTKREYEFIIQDIYGDGLCCRPDVTSGYYKIYRKREDDGNKKWQLLVAGSDFDTKVVAHHFVMHHAVGVRNPNLSSSSQTTGELVQASLALPSTVVMTSLALTCPPPRRKITVQIKTDKNGGVISWDFRIKDGPIIAKNEKKYQSYELDERDICVDDSALYELSVYDDDMDGMHAFNRAKGPDGHYKILAHRDGGSGGGGMDADLMRETILYGGYFKSNNITHLINTTMPTMTARDASWLDSHNKRRKYWHPYYNTTYVPLQWSESLKAEAQVWANKLLDACGDGMYHDPERDYGENAAANVGAGSWGELRVPDKIVARFIDNEVDLPWPHNGHLTQALWRASHYVGCADSHKLMDDAGIRQCHTQVCRYARTGNCNMGAFKDEAGEIDWLTPTLEDENYCSDICPIDGCRA